MKNAPVIVAALFAAVYLFDTPPAQIQVEAAPAAIDYQSQIDGLQVEINGLYLEIEELRDKLTEFAPCECESIGDQPADEPPGEQPPVDDEMESRPVAADECESGQCASPQRRAFPVRQWRPFVGLFRR